MTCRRCGGGQATICLSCTAELQEGRVTAPAWWPEWVKDDSDYRAALYILDAPVLRGKGRQLFDDTTRSIRFQDVPSLDWSSGQMVVVKAARSLFNGMTEVSLRELAGALDDASFERVMTAMRLWRDGSLLET